MLARGLLCRLAAETPKTSTHDLPQLARLLQRNTLSRNAARSLSTSYALSRAVNAVFAEIRRSYATTSATESGTKPTAAVKAAVKSAAAKKPAPKKGVAAKKTANKAAPAKKKKTTAAKKKPAQKKKLRRARKVLTDEEKRKKLISELKKKALREPVARKPLNASTVFIKEAIKGSEGPATGSIKGAWSKYHALTPAEREHYNRLANEENAARAKQYKDWVHSYTVEEIETANRARTTLRRLLKDTQKKGPKNTQRIPDERHVKRTLPFSEFYSQRSATGDFKGIAPKDRFKLVAEEWKALSEAEKQKYKTKA